MYKTKIVFILFFSENVLGILFHSFQKLSSKKQENVARNNLSNVASIHPIMVRILHKFYNWIMHIIAITEKWWYSIFLAYEPLKLMHTVIEVINEVCSQYKSSLNVQNRQNMAVSYPLPAPEDVYNVVSTSALKNSRRKMEDRSIVIHDLNTIFTKQVCGLHFIIHILF